MGFERRERVSVDAHQLSCDALTDLWEMLRLAQHGQSGVGVDIDETGRDHVTGGVDFTSGGNMIVVAPVNGDGIAIDQHSAEEARTAGAIDDLAVGNL